MSQFAHLICAASLFLFFVMSGISAAEDREVSSLAAAPGSRITRDLVNIYTGTLVIQHTILLEDQGEFKCSRRSKCI